MEKKKKKMNCCRRRQPAHHLRRPTPAELPRRYLSACCRSTIISRPHRIEFQIAQLLALYVRNEGGKEKKHSFKADRLDGPTPPCIFFPFSVPKKPRDYALDFPSRDCEFRRCFRLSRSSGDRRFRPFGRRPQGDGQDTDPDRGGTQRQDARPALSAGRRGTVRSSRSHRPSRPIMAPRPSRPCGATAPERCRGRPGGPRPPR